MSSDSFTPAGPLAPRTKKVLSTVIAIGLILIGALFIYMVLVAPSKQAYKDALAQYTNVYNANVNLTTSGASLNAGSANNEQFNKNVDTLAAAVKSLKTENDALAKHDVLAEGEGATLYKSFNQQLTKYIAYNEAVISSIRTFRPILFECSANLSTVRESAESAAEIRTCAARMGEVTNLANSSYQMVARQFNDIYGRLAANLDAAAALQDPNGVNKSAHTVLTSERESLLQELNDASRTLATSLQAERAKVDITKQAMALDAYLKDKASIF